MERILENKFIMLIIVECYTLR